MRARGRKSRITIRSASCAAARDIQSLHDTSASMKSKWFDPISSPLVARERPAHSTPNLAAVEDVVACLAGNAEFAAYLACLPRSAGGQRNVAFIHLRPRSPRYQRLSQENPRALAIDPARSVVCLAGRSGLKESICRRARATPGPRKPEIGSRTYSLFQRRDGAFSRKTKPSRVTNVTKKCSEFRALSNSSSRNSS